VEFVCEEVNFVQLGGEEVGGGIANGGGIWSWRLRG